MVAGQRQLTGALSIKKRIGRDIILTYDTRKLWYVYAHTHSRSFQMQALMQRILSTSQLIRDNQDVLKLKTKAQLLYGATKIMRQQSYFLYGIYAFTHIPSIIHDCNQHTSCIDDSAKLWSKLKSDMLNPTVSSFIDMNKTMPTQVPYQYLVFSCMY